MNNLRDMTKYNYIRNTLETLDIVLFSGEGIISNGIKLATGNKWSHIGVVFNIREVDMVCLLESTTLSSVEDVITGKGFSGVQIVPLSQRVLTYQGDISIRQLSGFTKLLYHKEVLNKFRRNYHGVPYEQNKIELVKSAYDGPWGDNVEDLSSLFCSEVVAELYQKMDLLPEGVPSNEYTPANFAKGMDLKLLKNTFLGEEIPI